MAIHTAGPERVVLPAYGSSAQGAGAHTRLPGEQAIRRRHEPYGPWNPTRAAIPRSQTLDGVALFRGPRDTCAHLGTYPPCATVRAVGLPRPGVRTIGPRSAEPGLLSRGAAVAE